MQVKTFTLPQTPLELGNKKPFDRRPTARIPAGQGGVSLYGEDYMVTGGLYDIMGSHVAREGAIHWGGGGGGSSPMWRVTDQWHHRQC